jgi:hypothetical protein
MWFNSRDISVSDRLRSRCGPDDRVSQTNSVVAMNRSLLELPSESFASGNAVVHAEKSERIRASRQINKSIRFIEDCEPADGRHPYPAGR